MALDLSTPCIPWTGSIQPAGYGTLSGKLAHRLVFEAVYGPIADGLQVGHACHDADLTCPGGRGRCPHRACINIFHLIAQTQSENQRSGVRGRRTSCVNGHPYDEANTYFRPTGQRDCRACFRERSRRYRQSRAAA